MSHLLHDTLDAARLIVDRRVFVDSIKVYFDRQLEHQELGGLLLRSGDFIDLGPMQHQEKKWPHGVFLHQPSDECLAILGTLSGRHLVSRLDISLDLITQSAMHAERLAKFVAQRLVQPWHGPSQVVVKGRTIYYRRRGSARNLVLYDDRPSKASGAPYCVHLEWRMEIAEGVKGVGFTSAADLAGADFRPFFARHLVLRRFPTELKDLARIGRALKGVGKSRPREIMRLGRGRLIDRYPMRAWSWLQQAEEIHRWYGPSVQDVLDKYGSKWAYLFPKLPIDWMLPQPVARSE